MCGIAGFIAKGAAGSSLKLIQRMTDAVAHRGPDGDGIWNHGDVYFGHRRLAIIELSDLGRQPMLDDQTGCVVTYNGEIYNYRELRDELSAIGHQFRTGSDTEVLLKAYRQWGAACVHRFNGMWAFAIFDPRQQTVFCSRDRFGVKPFYYTDSPRGFGFGSEIRQLLPLLERREADLRVVMNFLAMRVAEDVEASFFAGIKKLPGGHNLTYDLKRCKYRVERYYELTKRHDAERLDTHEALDAFSHLFEDAVRLRLRSDVKVGTCLSGGMDSSSIATLSSEIYRKANGNSFTAITAISEDPTTDESSFAKSIVEQCGLEWLTVKPKASDFESAIDTVVRTQEEPFAGTSIFMQYFVMEKARQADIPVLLDGQGGDETLLGYERYFADYFMEELRSGRVGNAVGTIRGLCQNGRSGAIKAFLWNLAYFHAPGLRKLGTPRGFFKDRAMAAITANVERPVRGDLYSLQTREIGRDNLPALLRYEDKNSMAHSVETRLPFLDYRLVELSTSIATGLKLHDGWGKHLLRRAMEQKMPAEIVWRKHKFGFESPERKWMEQHAPSIDHTIRTSELVRTICSESSVDTDRLASLNQGMRWRLFSLAKWAETFEVPVAS